jgi:hypothetical protein
VSERGTSPFFEIPNEKNGISLMLRGKALLPGEKISGLGGLNDPCPGLAEDGFGQRGYDIFILTIPGK